MARVPYFAYLSVMHLRETFGERGLGDKMRTHYAEADNELHHLLIMESLGTYAWCYEYASRFFVVDSFVERFLTMFSLYHRRKLKSY